VNLLTIGTLNLEDGRELDLLPDLVSQVPGIDILLFQEARSFDSEGQALRFRAEGLLAPLGLDRSFLTRSTRGQLHEMVFIRTSRLHPVAHFTPDLPDVFHDQIGWVQVRAEGMDAPLHLRSVQWAHWNGDVRLDEAQKLTRYAAPHTAAVIGGDFNSLWPDCPGHEPEFEPDWEALPPHKRHHKTLPPGLRPDGRLASDRRALSVLAGAGFTSAGCAARDVTVTVNAQIDNGQGARIDHLVLSPMLAAALVPGAYRVHVSDTGNRASDHRLVTAQVDQDLITLAASADQHVTRTAAP
jgi:endonuclease/exonuclease/phosphatase family metal-dependent hydrolase